MLCWFALAVPGVVLTIRGQDAMSQLRFRIDAALTPLADGALWRLRARF